VPEPWAGVSSDADDDARRSEWFHPCGDRRDRYSFWV
jgi:hypothetical protein